MLAIRSGQLKLYSSVKETSVDWLWYPYIPFGKVTLLQGDPGGGKSTLMMNIIAAVSNGAASPDGVRLKKPMHVIYQCSEDGASDTIKPRLIKAGADCDNVAFIDEEIDSLTLNDENLRSAIRYTYDEKGNCETSREYEIYDDEETIKWTSADTWNKEYNEKGQEIKCTHYGETGVERYRQEFAYDEKGNQTEMRWYALNRLSMEDSWDKEYDENGNCVKQIEFGPDGTEYLKREYRYARFENGAVVTTAPAVTTTTEAPTTTAAKKVGYATDALNVRRDASTDHDRVGMLKKGDAVTIIGEEGDFYKIEYKWTQEGSSGDYAFVSKEYVSDKKPG